MELHHSNDEVAGANPACAIFACGAVAQQTERVKRFINSCRRILFQRDECCKELHGQSAGCKPEVADSISARTGWQQRVL